MSSTEELSDGYLLYTSEEPVYINLRGDQTIPKNGFEVVDARPDRLKINEDIERRIYGAEGDITFPIFERRSCTGGDIRKLKFEFKFTEWNATNTEFNLGQEFGWTVLPGAKLEPYIGEPVTIVSEVEGYIFTNGDNGPYRLTPAYLAVGSAPGFIKVKSIKIEYFLNPSQTLGEGVTEVQTNITNVDIEKCYDDIKKTRLVTYEDVDGWCGDGVTHEGYVTSEVAQVFPTAISEQLIECGPLAGYTARVVSGTEQIKNAESGALRMLMQKMDSLESAVRALQDRITSLEAPR
jgi:hypothetical protein